MKLLVPCGAVVVQPGLRVGKGLLGSHHFSRGQGEKLSVLPERRGSCSGPFAYGQ